MKIASIGFVCAQDKTGLAITTSIGDNGHAISPLTIPWAAIVKLSRIGGDK